MSDKPSLLAPRDDQPTPTQLMADAFRMTHISGVTGGAQTAPPVCITPPVISGDPIIGTWLSTSLGVWDGAPNQYTGAWFDQQDKHVGDGASYQIQPQDKGGSIYSVVSATNWYGTTDSPPSNAIIIP